MKKTRLFLLCGILVSLFPAALNATAKPQYSVSAEEEPGLNYIETIDAERLRINRACIDYSPTEIYEQFAAPNGSVFKLHAFEEELELLEEDVSTNIPELEDLETIPMVDVVVRRGLNGVYIYSESNCDWDILTENLSDFIAERLESYSLYEIQDKKTELTVDGTVEVEIYTPGSFSNTYCYTFDIPSYTAKPYKDGDILGLRMGTFAHGDENRITFSAEFNTPIFGTSAGFITDGREINPYDPDSFVENFTIDIIDAGTNTILVSSNDDFVSIEISPIPKQTMTVYARVSFREDNIPYTFYSNKLVCEDQIQNALLDGYNNRDSYYVKEQEHMVTIPTTIPHEEISNASILLYYFENGEPITISEHSYDSILSDEEIKEITENPDLWYVQLFNGVCSNEFFDFKLPFNKIGDYDLYADIHIYSENIIYDRMNAFIKTIHVVSEPIIYTSDVEKIISSDITINGEEIKNSTVNDAKEICIRCVSGGAPIVINSTIASDLLNDGEAPVFTLNENSGGAVQIKTENEGRTLLITPYSSGTCKLELATEVRGFGTVKKVFNISVDADLTDKVQLTIPDEFHYSGVNLPVEANPINGQKYSNLSLTWKVLDKEGKEVEFIETSSTSIEVVKPSQNDYTIYAYYNGFEICSFVANVRDFNMEAFIKNNIAWIMLIAFSLLGLAIMVNIFLKKKNTIIDQMNLSYERLKEINLGSENADKDVARVKLLLQTCLSYSNDLNIDGLNQYEKTIRYLTKAMNGVKKLDKDVKLKEGENREEILEQAKKDLAKAIMVVTDIQTARTIAEENSFIANTNNYAKLEKEKKSKRKE